MLLHKFERISKTPGIIFLIEFERILGIFGVTLFIFKKFDRISGTAGVLYFKEFKRILRTLCVLFLTEFEEIFNTPGVMFVKNLEGSRRPVVSKFWENLKESWRCQEFCFWQNLKESRGHFIFDKIWKRVYSDTWWLIFERILGATWKNLKESRGPLMTCIWQNLMCLREFKITGIFGVLPHTTRIRQCLTTNKRI